MPGVNDRVFHNMRKRMTEFQDEFAEEFITRVRNRTPVDTGRLRAGWDIGNSGKTVVVVNDVEYASYVEDGTEHMRGAHMLKVTLAEKQAIGDKVTRKLRAKYKGR